MTTYTTTEHRALTYYRADLNRIAPLTREEEASLVERLRLAREQALPLEVVTAAKHRLVEGLQRLVLFLARKQAPRFVRQDLEDLIQEASLALLEATERCAFVRETFSGYASYVIRRAFTTARTQDFPVSITPDILIELARRDGIRSNPLLWSEGLETPVEGTDDLILADTLETPTPLSAEASADPQKTALVESLLAGLSERQQVALRLRYGLDETDGRERSIAEIGARLGMTDSAVRSLLQHALISCRRLAARQETATPARRTRPAPTGHMSPQQEAKLQQAVQAMQERGERITGNRLATLAHVDTQIARAYARTHRDPAYEALLQERDWHRLAEACAVLEAQGQPITAQALVSQTHLGTRVIGAFLNARAGNAQERLTDAYRLSQAQGHKKIGTRRLSQVAGVSEHRAGLFLRAQAAG
jgi:RNA polymerase sporulation-specific sigma factor